MLRLRDLEYDLPPDRVAASPAEPRDSARMLVCRRSDPGFLADARVRDLPAYLAQGDVIVFNTSAVLPARLEGRRAPTGARVAGLFLSERAPGRWEVMLRSNSPLRPGAVIDLAPPDAAPVRLTLAERLGGGAWLAEVAGADGQPAAQTLATVGATPLPPYILKARKDRRLDIDDALDRGWYQTVYADPNAAGSVAAPTAGLHFTPRLLDELRGRGVLRADVTLHVGAGTFKPVETEWVEDHPMHEEWRQVPRETLARIDAARAAGRACLAVGTTAARALESVADPAAPLAGPTRILITPGHRWSRVDALLTNFHLPRTTLLAMVASLFTPPGADPDVGVRRLLDLYRHALAERYRFFSYGDAMLVLP